MTQRLGTYHTWYKIGKGIVEFVRHCRQCVDPNVCNTMSRPVGDLVNGRELGGVLHFYYFSLGESEVIDTYSVVNGGYRYVMVPMDFVSQFIGLETMYLTEGAVRAVLKWYTSFGLPKAYTTDGGTHIMTIGGTRQFCRGECFVVARGGETDEP